MRGPTDSEYDVELESLQESSTDEAPRRPPGGKALQRLLQVLDSAGYSAMAEAAVHVAVNEDDLENFESQTNLVSAAPPGSPGHNQGAQESMTVEDAAAESAAVGDAYMEVATHLTATIATAPQWRSLGPWTIPNGQTYGRNRVNVSGRVSAIAVDPSNPGHVLAGAANGGVWESFDRGASWAPRTDHAPTLAVGALAFDPSVPSTVYCGTGEGDWWSFLGAGVLRSNDGGTSWSVLCTDPFVGQGFFDFLVDPADGQHLLAATTGGVFMSTDGGVNWSRRRSVISWSVTMPANGASAEILASSRDGIWQSMDGGATWDAVDLPGAPASFTRLAVRIAPSNADVAYAWGASGSTALLWRRSGGSWAAVSPPPGADIGQAWYDWFLAVAPDRETQVYCGAIEAHRGDLSGSSWSWTNLSKKGFFGDSIHPDQHSIAFEPGQPDTVYIGNDGGLFRSTDRGVHFEHCNNGLVITEFEYIAQDFGSSRWLIGGTQDNGTARWTGSQTWHHAADGDGGDCGVNRTNPETVFHSFYRMTPERSTQRGEFGSWSRVFPPAPNSEGSLFYPPFECSATGGDTVAMGGDALYVSRNNASAWTRLAFPTSARASAMWIPDIDNVYVGALNGRIYHTQWDGSTWSPMTTLTTPRANAVVSDLYVDPNSHAYIWATYRTVGGGRVFVSEDGGATWMDRSAGLPSLPINAVETDPLDANRAWVAADLGVFETRDRGATWVDFTNGLPNMFVGDLLFHPHARVLRAATRSRGVWEIPVDGWMTQPICGVQWSGRLEGNQTREWRTHSWPATWTVVWTIVPLTSGGGTAQLSWDVRVERADAEYVTYWISVQNFTGSPVEFEGRYSILSRY